MLDKEQRECAKSVPGVEDGGDTASEGLCRLLTGRSRLWRESDLERLLLCPWF